MLYFGAVCSPWYLVGSVLLIYLVLYVVLWYFMFTVVVGGVRVTHLFSFLCCALVLYVHRGIWWGRVTHLFSFLCCALVLYVHCGIWWGPCYSSV